MARPSSAGPAPDVVNLDVNTCVLPEQSALLARSLASLVKRPAAFDAALQLASPSGSVAARQTAATFFARAGWTPDPEAVTFAASGKAALAAAIAALVPPGQRLGVVLGGAQARQTGVAVLVGGDDQCAPPACHGWPPGTHDRPRGAGPRLPRSAPVSLLSMR